MNWLNTIDIERKNSVDFPKRKGSDLAVGNFKYYAFYIKNQILIYNTTASQFIVLEG